MVRQYEIEYDMIVDLQQEIITILKTKVGEQNSRSVNALSATYILQDYLAGRIATIGESPEGEDMDGLTWDKIKEVVAYYERGNSDET